MEKRTVFYAEFLSQGLIVANSWHVPLVNPDPHAVKWPDNAYAFRIYQREDVVDGETVYTGTAHPRGALYFHPDSVVETLDQVKANPKATPILISNMECNNWHAVVWCRSGGWPQPFDQDVMQVLSKPAQGSPA